MAKLLTGNNPESQGSVQEMEQTLRTVKELFVWQKAVVHTKVLQFKDHFSAFSDQNKILKKNHEAG